MTSPDQELQTNPKWRASDLGAPLPVSAHANSVCLPTWQDVIDYEERNPRVMDRLQAGYPRFVVPAQCAEFFKRCRLKYARTGELCHAYPSARTARRCASFIKKWSDHTARVVECPEDRIFLVCFPAIAEKAALKYWRHTGEGISSRQAESLLTGKSAIPAEDARKKVIQRIAQLAGAPEHCIYFFKSGMAAIYAVHRAVERMKPSGTCVQFGFPYVDTLKILQEFGSRHRFYPRGDQDDIRMLAVDAEHHDIAGIFCEFPSNPLLRSPDLAALAALARPRHAPLVVDDTISTWINVDLLRVADVTVTSLTKFFTGRGDVMAGAAILNPESPVYPLLHASMDAEFEDTSWGENILLMEQHSRDFQMRVRQINNTTEKICDWLQARTDVETVYYPKFQSRDVYERFRKPEGGYGGLFSILLKDAALRTPRFYEQLEISKGPNLGTTFSLCCPFTMLAHYDELPWAEACGVSRYLLRFSVGLEPAADLIARLERAFSASA